MMGNLVVGEALRVFKQKAQERGKEKNVNHELRMKDPLSHFLPTKALRGQKRYLRRELYKLRGTKISNFVCRIDEMVAYLENFPTFGMGQRLPEEEIL